MPTTSAYKPEKDIKSGGELIVGTKGTDPYAIDLGTEGIDRVKQRRERTDAQRRATEAMLGGAVGAAGNLADQGIELGDAGRLSMINQQRLALEQQQQLLGQAVGQTPGAAYQQTQLGLQAADAGIQSQAGAVMGRGAIAANALGDRAQEALGRQGQSALEQAQLQDQMAAQNLLAEQIAQQQGLGLTLGQGGADTALGGTDLQRQQLTGILGGVLDEQGQLTDELLKRRGWDIEAQTQLQELLSQQQPKQGLLGGTINAIGGALATFG